MWDVPLGALLMLLGQAGPERPARPFGSATAELCDRIELPETFDGPLRTPCT